METLRDRLARRLRQLMRADINMDTQTKVADRSGVSQSSVQRLLTRGQAATLDVLDQLAPAFGIQRAERFLLDQEDLDVLAAWDKLTDQQRADLMGHIRVITAVSRAPAIDNVMAMTAERHLELGQMPSARARFNEARAAAKDAAEKAVKAKKAKPPSKSSDRAH